VRSGQGLRWPPNNITGSPWRTGELCVAACEKWARAGLASNQEHGVAHGVRRNKGGKEPCVAGTWKGKRNRCSCHNRSIAASHGIECISSWLHWMHLVKT
jgi:hypothetical protein